MNLMDLEQKLAALHEKCAVVSGLPEHEYWHNRLLTCLTEIEGRRPLTPWEAWVMDKGPIPSHTTPS